MVKKTIAAIFSVLVLSTVLTACNTTRGVGEDISDGGNAISGAAIAISNNGTTGMSCRLFFLR
ncbi:lipoprotein toxin entericidin B [Escherichia coli]|nr:lipoprotein toxin entericidin B [Escherichia coli]EER1686042.1 lipoprotein toxin entericidin B [Escherichia coli]EIP0562096.1 lipoprotein toxin entericidin B [Escherichia coli]EIP0566642.1 lipoprotein toxin entericidin B [Escherichia coli]EIP0566650.1 lipoprotein toxin entericidin B [Escherichia coli]